MENRIVVENSTNFLWEKAYRIKYPDGDCWAIEFGLFSNRTFTILHSGYFEIDGRGPKTTMSHQVC